jgi:hypothetical protein
MVAEEVNGGTATFPNLARHISNRDWENHKDILVPDAQAIVDEVTSIVLEEFVAAGIPREMQREEGRRERGPFQMYKDVEHLRIQNGGFPEVPTSLVAFYNGWTFERAWYYYRAKGDGIPPDIAEEFHQTWGRQVRVEGHCGCPSPLEWCQGFAVGSYHIDTPAGLKAFIGLLDRVYKPQKRK